MKLTLSKFMINSGCAFDGEFKQWIGTRYHNGQYDKLEFDQLLKEFEDKKNNEAMATFPTCPTCKNFVTVEKNPNGRHAGYAELWGKFVSLHCIRCDKEVLVNPYDYDKLIDALKKIEEIASEFINSEK